MRVYIYTPFWRKAGHCIWGKGSLGVVDGRPYALTIVLSLLTAGCNLLSMSATLKSNQRGGTGVGHFVVKFGVFSLDNIRGVGVCRDSNS